MNQVKQLAPIDALKKDIQLMSDQFGKALPSHIPAERFVRVIMTAVSQNPDVALANRQSFMSAAMKCAQDGLVPDGREAALVHYKMKSGEVSVSYQPMVSGIIKRARNSGEIGNWSTQVVKTNDEFDFELGDNEFMRHKPALSKRGDVMGAYSIVTLKDGTKSREWMNIEEINAIRARSKSGDYGPWKSDFDEMCKKTVIKRHSKRLPMSTDLEEFLHQDDDIIDVGDKPVVTHPQPQMEQAPAKEVKKSRAEAIVAQSASEVLPAPEPQPIGPADVPI